MPEERITSYLLVFDNGYHEDEFDSYPPTGEIEDARRAAPDAWTQVVAQIDGWERMTVAEWPPIESDPRDDAR